MTEQVIHYKENGVLKKQVVVFVPHAGESPMREGGMDFDEGVPRTMQTPMFDLPKDDNLIVPFLKETASLKEKSFKAFSLASARSGVEVMDEKAWNTEWQANEASYSAQPSK